MNFNALAQLRTSFAHNASKYSVLSVPKTAPRNFFVEDKSRRGDMGVLEAMCLGSSAVHILATTHVFTHLYSS